LVGIGAAAVYFAGLVFYWNGPEARSRTAREVFSWVTVIALIPLLWRGWQIVNLSHSEPSIVRLLIIFAAVFCLIALFTTPYHSTDVFGYVNRGWQQLHYGQDPYVHTVSEISNRAGDPMLREHWIYNPSPYGFLFTGISYVACWLGQGNWWVTLLIIKFVNVLAYACTGVLVWLGTKALGREHAEGPLYLFLWNPIILVHNLANGHNDLIVGMLVLMSFYLALRRVYFWIIPFVVMGVLIKYAPIVMLPFAVGLVWRKVGSLRAAGSCLFAVVLAALASLPYIGDWRSFRLEDIRDNAVLIDNSLHSFLIHFYELVSKFVPQMDIFHDAASSAIAIALRVATLLTMMWLLLRFLKNVDETRFVKYSALCLFLLIFVGSSKLNGWYVGMLLGPVLLLDREYWLRRLMLLFSATQLGSITFLKQAYILNYIVMMLVPQWYVWRERRRSEQRSLNTETVSA
jgi:hypothetical protein